MPGLRLGALCLPRKGMKPPGEGEGVRAVAHEDTDMMEEEAKRG